MVTSSYGSRPRSALAQDILTACNAIPECDLFVLFPLGKSLDGEARWETSAFLKTARDTHDPTKLMCALPGFHACQLMHSVSMHNATQIMSAFPA